MADPIPFECSNRPWFGPRKRAREHLALRTAVQPPAVAAESFAQYFSPYSTHIQRIRFIDYVHNETPPFRFTIALIWTLSNDALRDRIYTSAEELTKTTGWYPLPQGERIGSRAAYRGFLKTRVLRLSGSVSVEIKGRLTTIQNAVDPDGGCSLRVQSEQGALLLDTGLPGHLKPEPSDRLILLSHYHSDHSGGLTSPNRLSVPVVMTETTARMLIAAEKMRTSDMRRGVFIIPHDEELRIGDLAILAFPVPHCPGSTGYVIADEEKRLIYTGDLAVRSYRHDFRPTLTRLLESRQDLATTVLLDATMAGRKEGASPTNAAKQTVDHLQNVDDILILSNDPDQLLYAYLDLFFFTKERLNLRSGIQFIAGSRIRSIVELVHSAFIARRLEELDPFILSQYGKSMSAWAESRWLFWLGPDLKIPLETPLKRIWLTTLHEISSVKFRERAGTVRVGRAASDSSLTLPAPELQVDSSAWTQHSDEESLSELVASLSGHAKVGLYHNFPKKLTKFVAKNALSCFVIRDTPEALAR